mgnify:CR=1 FL=1
MQMRRTLACVILAAFVLTGAVALAAELQTITGTVTMACPKGCALKVKSETTEVMLWVHPKCPHRDALMTQIKGLKAGDHVVCKYATKDGKNYVMQITKK